MCRRACLVCQSWVGQASEAPLLLADFGQPGGRAPGGRAPGATQGPERLLGPTPTPNAGPVQAGVRHEFLLAVGEEEVVVEQRAALLLGVRG